MRGFRNSQMLGGNTDAERKFNEARLGHQAGDPRGTRALAYCYLAGYGTARSLDKAVTLLTSIKDFEGARAPYHLNRPDKIEGGPSFVDALKIDFKPLQSIPLPITGGWGYEKESAIVIDPSIVDPGYHNGDPFDFEGLKKLLVTHRIYEECCVRQFDPLDGLSWKLDASEEIKDEDGLFEHLTFTVSGYPLWVWNALRDDWISASRHLNAARTRLHDFIRQWFVKSFKADYWFDISSSAEDGSQ